VGQHLILGRVFKEFFDIKNIGAQLHVHAWEFCKQARVMQRRIGICIAGLQKSIVKLNVTEFILLGNWIREIVKLRTIN
jgi:hypothetical protein